MNKIVYNLASTRKVNGRAFACRMTVLALTALLLSGVAIVNLVRQHEKSRAEKSESGRIEQHRDEMKRRSDRWKNEIVAWQRIMKRDLATANALIAHKSFSFISRLDFLEKTFSPGIRIRHLSLGNEPTGRISMTISAQSLKELFGLYKKLSPYNLVIANETQAEGEYQVRLNFEISHEKI